MNTSEVDKSWDIITATKETYAQWGFDWEVPPEWKKDQLEFMMKVNKV